jgi:catechol 2,3-dioxygenase
MEGRAMIKIERVGHVVMSVRNLERSRDFYARVLGLQVMGELPGVLFMSAGGRDHHEIAIAEVGEHAIKARQFDIGMVHFAFKLRNKDDLREAYQTLLDENVEISCTVNHGVTDSIYFFDPDGHELEVYADNSPEEVATFSNPYGGMEKLPFALEQPSFLEATDKVRKMMEQESA